MLDPDDPSAAIGSLHEGCQEAMSALYDRYSEVVWRYVARLLGPDTAAIADVMQETFLAAVEAAQTFDANRGSLRAWLTGIAHHRVKMHWWQRDRVERLRQLAESRAVDIRGLLDSDDSTSRDWNRRELSDLVRGVLAEMSADYAELLAAKYLEDRSVAEIANDNDSTVDAVKSKLARARSEFRAKFEHFTREPSAK